MILRSAMAALLALGLGGQALAGEAWYLGIGAAFSRADVDVGRSTALIGAKWNGSPTQVEDEGDGLKVYAGWQPSRLFSVELGYTDFGRVSTYSTLLATARRDTVSSQWEGHGVDLSALAHWWIGETFALYARGGASLWTLERRVVEDGTSGYAARTQSEDGVAGMAGLGVAARFGERGRLRAEFQRYFKVGVEDPAFGLRTDIDVISISAQYHF